jgi:hypothetical protein
MARPPRNPFYAVLGIVGFAFTITAAAYCVAVLRGVRPASETGGRHPLDRLMDDHGTTILVVEIALLAVATVGAIWLDHLAGERIRRERAARETAVSEETVGVTDAVDTGADAS